MARLMAWLDRHAGAIISGSLGIIALVSAAGFGVLFDMSRDIGGLQSDVENTSKSVRSIKGTLSDTYTVERAKEAHRRIWQTDADQYSRIEEIQGQVRENTTRIDGNAVAIERLRSRQDAVYRGPYRHDYKLVPVSLGRTKPSGELAPR